MKTAPSNWGCFRRGKLCLHYWESFVDRNLATTLQNRAALGHLDGRIQRICLDNCVAAGHCPHRAVTDGSIARDAFSRRGKGIASIDDCIAESTVPGSPCLHDGSSFSFSLGHAATAIE